LWYVTLCCPLKVNRSFKGTCHSACCLLLAGSLSQMMEEATCSSEMSVDFLQNTEHYIPGGKLLVTSTVRTSNPTIKDLGFRVFSYFKWKAKNGGHLHSTVKPLEGYVYGVRLRTVSLKRRILWHCKYDTISLGTTLLTCHHFKS
jgi:hypothetical protein